MLHAYPESLANTEKIAEKCHVEIQFGQRHLPGFTAPDGMDNNEYLRKLCREGLERKMPGASQAVRERLEHEVDVIIQMGFVDYFLIVWDFVDFAHRKGIFVGPGRGSGAGSLAAYAMDITDIDPIKYDLIFERFLNPERVSMPDFDIDFCIERRQEVIDYVVQNTGRTMWLRSSPSAPWPPRRPSGTWAGRWICPMRTRTGSPSWCPMCWASPWTRRWNNPGSCGPCMKPIPKYRSCWIFPGSWRGCPATPPPMRRGW